jgi:hypothetical protein
MVVRRCPDEILGVANVLQPPTSNSGGCNAPNSPVSYAHVWEYGR